MQRPTAGPAFLLLVALLIAACGGGGAASPGGDAGSGGGGGTATDVPADSDAPAATDEPAASPASAASEPATGGGTAAGVCDLVTTDELTAAFGVASVTTQVFAGPPDTCSVSGPDGTALVAWVLSPQGGAAVYDAIALPDQSTNVDGLGDRAAFVENTGLLILKGDRLLSISITGSGDLTPEEADAIAKQLGSHASGRM